MSSSSSSDQHVAFAILEFLQSAIDTHKVKADDAESLTGILGRRGRRGGGWMLDAGDTNDIGYLIAYIDK